MRSALYAVLFVLAFLAPTWAEVRIEASPGGEATSFVKFFEMLRQSGQRVVIDGPCFSACTLVLDIIPHSRICVTPRAVLGFHAAKLVDQYGNEYPASASGQRAWDAARGHQHSLHDPLRPGESYETISVFDVPADAQTVRMFAGWNSFPSYLLIGDEASPGHRKTYLALW